MLLLQDAVLAAARPGASPEAAMVNALLSNEVPFYVAEQDLQLRGFSAADLPARVQSVHDRRLVDLVMAEDTRALGCF